jgi:tetratricopeptide (TPR) repeat protein
VWIIWIIAPLLAAGPSLPIEGPGGPAGALLGWMLAHKKAGPKADGDKLRQVLQDGETVRLDGGHRSAAARFGAMILDPAYADLAGTSDYDNVRYHLAAAWLADGAVGKARRLLLEMVGRKPQSDFRAPAFRKLMDLTLGSGQHEQTLSVLFGMSIAPSQDENDEIAYLKGKALLRMGYADQALESFSSVTHTSRQYAAATYLAGIAELKRGAEVEAEDHFCKLVSDASARAAPGQTRFFLSESAVGVV